MYTNQKILLATKHEKEEAIAPVFLKNMNAKIIVPENFDTDQFGTFTGEIPRKLSPKETCTEKAKQAAIQYGFNYAVASEGSFGPHPSLYFVPADIEIVSFVDLKNNLTITEHLITQETNYSHQEITSKEKYEEFLKKAKFPTHGLIIRDLTTDCILKKGIKEKSILETTLKTFFNKNNKAKIRLETDMRAMMNPTRMQVIRQVTEQLVIRLTTLCPKCASPGFGIKSVEGHLPCKWCGSESTLYKYIVYSCIQCDYKEKKLRQDGLAHADPAQCSLCNP